MRKEFPGYYPPTEAEIELLWSEGLLVLDTNILLHLYRYSKSTRETLLGVIKGVKDRLWLPYQIAFEYQTLRLDRIFGERKNCENWLEELKRVIHRLDEPRRHPFVSEGLRKQFDTLIKEAGSEIKSAQSDFDNLKRDDKIFDALTEFYTGKVGPAPTAEQRDATLAEGEDRYRKGIPPGFEDRKKRDERKFGDLLIWKQILAKAGADKKPVLFVTDDGKADWWREIDGQTIGPLPSLTEEIRQVSGKPFHMYNAAKFMEYASERLKKKIEKKALTEIREAQEKDQHERKQLEEWVKNEAQRATEAYMRLQNQLARTQSSYDSALAESIKNASHWEHLKYKQLIEQNSIADVMRLAESHRESQERATYWQDIANQHAAPAGYLEAIRDQLSIAEAIKAQVLETQEWRDAIARTAATRYVPLPSDKDREVPSARSVNQPTATEEITPPPPNPETAPNPGLSKSENSPK